MKFQFKITETYPSVYSACNRPKYASHLLPMTLPQVKQRTGIIMIVIWLYFNPF